MGRAFRIEQEEQLGVAGVLVQQLFENGEGLGAFSGQDVALGQQLPHHQVAGHEGGGLLEGLDGLGRFPPGDEDLAQQAEGLAIPLEGEGLLGRFHGALEILFVQQELTELDAGLGFIRSEFRGGAQGRDGAIGMIREVPQELGHQEPGLVVAGAQGHYLADQVLGFVEFLDDLLQGRHGEEQFVVLGIQGHGLGEALGGLGQLGVLQEGGGLQQGPTQLGDRLGLGDGKDAGAVAGEEFPGPDELEVLLHQFLPALGKGLAIDPSLGFQFLDQGHEAIAKHDFGAFQAPQLIRDRLQIGLHPAQVLLQARDPFQEMLVEILVFLGLLVFLPALIAADDEEAVAAFATTLPIPGVPGEAILTIGTWDFGGHANRIALAGSELGTPSA